MKRFVCISVMILFFANVFGQAADSEKFGNFFKVYQKAVELNKDRFKDVNKIQIGDTILLPARSGSGTEAWIADAPKEGVNDCIWYITNRYLNGQLKTQVVDTMKIKPVQPLPLKPEIQTAKITNWIGNIMGILGILSLLCFLVYLLTRKKSGTPIFDRNIVTRRNPDLNSVIPGGLSNDERTALQQINAAYPNRPRALRIQRGIIEGPLGVSLAQVRMQFSDGTHDSELRSGEASCRVEREGNVVDFYRQHCGNLFGEIYQGGYNLPEGWTFKPVEETPALTPTGEVTETPAKKENADFEAPAIVIHDGYSAEETIKILESLKEAKPKKVKVGCVLVKF